MLLSNSSTFFIQQLKKVTFKSFKISFSHNAPEAQFPTLLILLAWASSPAPPPPLFLWCPLAGARGSKPSCSDGWHLGKTCQPGQLQGKTCGPGPLLWSGSSWGLIPAQGGVLPALEAVPLFLLRRLEGGGGCRDPGMTTCPCPSAGGLCWKRGGSGRGQCSWQAEGQRGNCPGLCRASWAVSLAPSTWWSLIEGPSGVMYLEALRTMRLCYRWIPLSFSICLGLCFLACEMGRIVLACSGVVGRIR